MSLDSKPSINNAGAPFADADADLILRSSDDVKFRVHRLFLSKASPIFADMFALPTGATYHSGGDEEEGGIRVVKMPEDEKSLRVLLGCCYLSMEPFILQSIDDAERAMVIADKFQIARLRSIAVAWYKENAHQNYERAYAFGWKMHSRDIVRSAALASLSNPHTVALPTSSEIADLPGVAILGLFTYQQACVRAALDVFNFDWFTNGALHVEEDSMNEWDPFWKGPRQIEYNTYHSHENCASYRRGNFTLDIHDGFTASVMPVMATYLKSAYRALRTHARGTAVDNETIIRSAYLKGFRNEDCASCGKEAVVLVPAFARLLASEVEKAVADVLLEMPF